MSYAQLELEVVRWAEARGIVQNSTPLAQARKTLEEAGELLEAAAQLETAKLLNGVVYPETKDDFPVPGYVDAYRDAIGDVLVTLIVGAACADVDLMECLQQAYDEIKDRKGTLREDGVFVKESDER